MCNSAHYNAVYLAKLVFGHDPILNTRHKTNWQIIKICKQDVMNKGNKPEKFNKKEDKYNKGDKVLLKNTLNTKFNQDAFLDPFIITSVRNNGSVRASKSKVTDT